MAECKILLYGKLGALLKPEDFILRGGLQVDKVRLPGMRVVEREVLQRAYSDIELKGGGQEDVLDGWLVTVDPWGLRNLCRLCGVGVVYRLDKVELAPEGMEHGELYVPRLQENLYEEE